MRAEVANMIHKRLAKEEKSLEKLEGVGGLPDIAAIQRKRGEVSAMQWCLRLVLDSLKATEPKG